MDNNSNPEYEDLHRPNVNINPDQTPNTRPSDEDAPLDLWDSLESDTESLVQEKAYQRQLQKRIIDGLGDSSLSDNDNFHNIQRSEHDDGCDPRPDFPETRGGPNTKFSR